MTNLHDENQIVAELPSSASDDYVLVTREQRMTWYGAASGAALFGIAILLPIMLMIAALVFPMGRSAPSVRRSAGVVVIIGGLLVAVPASRWVYRKLRWQWKMWDEKTCWGCGYDLTGNMSGKCPECGNAYNVEMRGTIHEHRSDVRTPR